VISDSVVYIDIDIEPLFGPPLPFFACLLLGCTHLNDDVSVGCSRH
jgi:hypothetical protein